MSDERRLGLAADVEQKESAVREAWAAFVDSQQGYVCEFLMEQGRTTAIQQEDVTKRLGRSVADFRADLAGVVDAIAVESNIYFHAMGDDRVLSGWEYGRNHAELDRITQPFGNFLIELGFDPETSRKHTGIYPDWYYYSENQFSNDLQRAGKGMPLHESLRSYSTKYEGLRAARAVLEAYDQLRSRGSVADEWDAAT